MEIPPLEGISRGPLDFAREPIACRLFLIPIGGSLFVGFVGWEFVRILSFARPFLLGRKQPVHLVDDFVEFLGVFCLVCPGLEFHPAGRWIGRHLWKGCGSAWRIVCGSNGKVSRIRQLPVILGLRSLDGPLFLQEFQRLADVASGFAKANRHRGKIDYGGLGAPAIHAAVIENLARQLFFLSCRLRFEQDCFKRTNYRPPQALPCPWTRWRISDRVRSVRCLKVGIFIGCLLLAFPSRPAHAHAPF
jgi:hypothetical protein